MRCGRGVSFFGGEEGGEGKGKEGKVWCGFVYSHYVRSDSKDVRVIVVVVVMGEANWVVARL